MTDHSLFVHHKGEFNRVELEELAKTLSLPPEIRISKYSNDEPYGKVWSARLSSGLFGLTSCGAGNRGPKSYSEVILAVGDDGLNKLIDLGFITCPVCHPEKISDFWKTVQKTVKVKYGLPSLDDFTNKDILPFDARRVEWEELLPIIGETPSRLYVPRGLSKSDLTTFNKRFADTGFTLPPTGYYDVDSPERFSEYLIPNLTA